MVAQVNHVANIAHIRALSNLPITGVRCLAISGNTDINCAIRNADSLTLQGSTADGFRLTRHRKLILNAPVANNTEVTQSVGGGNILVICLRPTQFRRHRGYCRRQIHFSTLINIIARIGDRHLPSQISGFGLLLDHCAVKINIAACHRGSLPIR